MIRLCGFHVSNYHNKVRIALLEKGIAFEEDASCRPSQKDEWVARSPMGKVPILEVDGTTLTESQVICEYLEDAYPEKPLYPKDPIARAKVRELVTHIEWHMEMVVRRLYLQAFFGGTVSEEVKQSVDKEITRGVRTLRALARFDPFIAGKGLTLADCAAFVHLPLVSLATKIVLGRDVLEDVPQVKECVKMLRARPAFARVDEDRKTASAAMAAAAKKS
ncbi:MAG: glutathione S-transferase [Burkholderiales bacterium]|nr:glutathione S-transferase [Burkholderiales bacterium]